MQYISLTNPLMIYRTAIRMSDDMRQLWSVILERRCFYNFKLINGDLYAIDDNVYGGGIKLDQMDVLASCGNIVINNSE